MEAPSGRSVAMRRSLGNNIRNPTQAKTISSKNCNKRSTATTKGVPDIAVTTTTDAYPFQTPKHSIPPKKARAPRLHVISAGAISSTGSKISVPQERQLQNDCQQAVISLLQEYFYVRNVQNRRRQSSQARKPTYDQASPPQISRISDSDVCVYVFNDTTVEDHQCFHDLCTAIALNIPVVYIRHYHQELPKTFAESVNRNSHGCTSLNEYIDRFVLPGLEQRYPTIGKRRLSRPNANRTITPITASTVTGRVRSSSASDLCVRGFDLRRSQRKVMTPHTDLLLYLINSFQHSYIFDENDLQRCSHTLRLGIYRSLGISEDKLASLAVTPSNNRSKSTKSSVKSGDILEQAKHSDFLKVPEATRTTATRPWESSGAISAPPNDNPGQDGRFTYDFHAVSPEPIEEKSTTYLIFDNASGKKIRKINFPLNENEVEDDYCGYDSDEFDPGGSPIQFPDIDLGREIDSGLDSVDFEL